MMRAVGTFISCVFVISFTCSTQAESSRDKRLKEQVEAFQNGKASEFSGKLFGDKEFKAKWFDSSKTFNTQSFSTDKEFKMKSWNGAKEALGLKGKSFATEGSNSFFTRDKNALNQGKQLVSPFQNQKYGVESARESKKLYQNPSLDRKAGETGKMFDARVLLIHRGDYERNLISESLRAKGVDGSEAISMDDLKEILNKE